MVRPNFFVMGAQKSGTTSLCALLGKHPDIFISNPKEPMAFNEPKQFCLDKYEQYFEKALGKKAIGEGSTSNSIIGTYPYTPQLMANHFPDAKLIYIVRDPIVRTYSAWWHYLTRNQREISFDFNDAVRLDAILIDAGLYLRQVEAFLKHYPRQQLRILFYDDFVANPSKVLSECCEFLGVGPYAFRLFRTHWNRARKARANPDLIGGKTYKPDAIPSDAKEYLQQQFGPATREFLRFCGKPANYWGDWVQLAPAYVEKKLTVVVVCDPERRDNFTQEITKIAGRADLEVIVLDFSSSRLEFACMKGLQRDYANIRYINAHSGSDAALVLYIAANAFSDRLLVVGHSCDDLSDQVLVALRSIAEDADADARGLDVGSSQANMPLPMIVDKNMILYEPATSEQPAMVIRDCVERLTPRKTHRPKVVCVIPSWDQAELLDKCLASLSKQNYANLEIIVVDNGSKDRTPQLVASRYPTIRLLRSQDNRGFGVGTNQGITVGQTLGADYFFLLNNDATVRADTIETLVSTAEQAKHNIGIWGSRVVEDLSTRNKTWYERLRTEAAIQMGSESRMVEHVFGCGMFVRARVFEDIGLFDERYFAYGEDLDLCRRARSHGWLISYCAGAIVDHLAAISTGGFSSDARIRAYLIGRNQVRYWRKFGGPSGVVNLALLPLRACLTLASSLVRPRPTAALAKIIGYYDGLVRCASEPARFPKFVVQKSKFES